jgi:hypothetical protein
LAAQRPLSGTAADVTEFRFWPNSAGGIPRRQIVQWPLFIEQFSQTPAPKYAEFSRALARENQLLQAATPHFREVPIRRKMESSPFQAERGLI